MAPAEGFVTVALVEDEPAIQQRLVNAIAGAPSLRLMHIASTAGDIVAWLETNAVDVLLVDLGLPDQPGLEVIRISRGLRPSCQVMVVTMFADEDHIVSAFEAGASGYLLKDGSESDLSASVLHLHAGGSPLSPMIARHLLKRWHATESRPNTLPSAFSPNVPEPLTGREGEILELVARGFTYVEIAAQLCIADSTVRTHVRSVYAKLDVHNKTEAVFEARSLGLLR